MDWYLPQIMHNTNDTLCCNVKFMRVCKIPAIYRKKNIQIICYKIDFPLIDAGAHSVLVMGNILY